MRVNIRKTLASAIVLFFTMRTSVSAQTGQIVNPSSYDSLTDIINQLFGLVRFILVILFIGVLMYGGFTYLTAGADDAKVANAKKILVSGIAGFIIAVLSPAIVQFVGRLLGVELI